MNGRAVSDVDVVVDLDVDQDFEVDGNVAVDLNRRPCTLTVFSRRRPGVKVEINEGVMLNVAVKNNEDGPRSTSTFVDLDVDQDFEVDGNVAVDSIVDLAP